MGKREEPRVKVPPRELDKQYDASMKETATEGLPRVRIYNHMERKIYEWAEAKGIDIEELPDFCDYIRGRYRRLKTKRHKYVRTKGDNRGDR